ncbi:MAG TPA: GNAT family N-acetyltransferase [Candidatus Deferrimicrobium sp.]|nr:GNAT family N-acetyltransferase [Candidatus Deferrimicrobium sp.]
MGVKVRLGRPEDAAGILECLLASVSERVWLDRDESEVGISNPDVLKERISKFKPDKNAYIVATMDSQIIGFILLVRGNLKSTKHLADFGMSILPAYREQGIGTMLVEEAINWAEHWKVEKLYCCTFHTNQRAIKLYEKLGFSREGTRVKQYKINGEYVDQLLFGKLL